MSVNTSIKEGGQARSFGPVKALMVQGSDGKYYPWYPESERQLDTLSVTKNGVYQAKKAGVYGWRSVNVYVQADRITGIGNDGNEHVVTTKDGEIVDTMVPTTIRVITPPSKIAYSDGETIDYSGIVVHAYSATGQDMGEVPFDELIFPITVVIDDPNTTIYEAKSGYNTGIFTQPIPWVHRFKMSFTFSDWGQSTNRSIEYYSETFRFVVIRVRDHAVGLLVACTDDASNVYSERDYRYNTVTGEVTDKTKINGLPPNSYTMNGKTFYYTYIAATYVGEPIEYSFYSYYKDSSYVPYPSDEIQRNAAYTILFGDIGIPVPVQWRRTGDDKLLETTFSITLVGGD